MCQTKVKVLIRKGKGVIFAGVKGMCDHCGKEHVIDIGDAQAANKIINAFKLKQENKVKDENGITYIYS